MALALIAASAAIEGAAILSRGSMVPERRVPDRPIQVPENGFVSSQTCKACHPSEYATWHDSYHRTMTQVATPESVAANFNGVQVNDVPGRPMLLEQRGNQLWAEIDDMDWDGKGDAPPRIRRQVVMTTGSHNQQIYWYATGHNRTLGQLPAIWVTSEQRWIPRRSAVMHPPGQPLFSETGSWNGICVQCHTTDGKPEFDTLFGAQPILSQVVDTKAAEFGISCESCHGPSQEHARLNRSPLRRYWFHVTGHTDPTTVLPTRLTPQRSSQVCGQCHGVWEFYNAQGELQANSKGLPYRPGDQLTDTRFMVQPSKNLGSPIMKKFLSEDAGFVRDVFWSDNMVRATGREYNGLLDSPCYKNATDDTRKMSCFSCHAMHEKDADERPAKQWADEHQLAPGAEDNKGNDACLQCHPTFRTNLTAHTKHREDSAGSSCYNCHMPYTTYGLLKTIRSHQISSPSVKANLDTGRPNACNLCHLDKTLGWTSESLEKWYGTPKPELTEDERSVAASLLVLLKGDAGQRAIISQGMGWAPAQQASGTNWLAPYLALSLDDPYDVVRLIAYRSLRTLPGFDGFQFNFVAPPQARAAERARALEIWQRAHALTDRRIDAALLINPDGTFNTNAVGRLREERNNRRVFYRE
jgi:hypothetical protein